MENKHNDIRNIYADEIIDSAAKIKESERAIPKLLGSVGAIAFVLGLIIVAITDKFSIFPLGLSGFGLLLLIAFVAMDFKQVKAFLTSRSTVYSTNLTIVILALFGILIIVNSVAANHYFSIDLTQDKINTLSDKTKTVCSEITEANRNVEITAFLRQDDARRLPVKLLFERYAHITNGMTFTFIDYEIKKKAAVDKGIDRPAILIESDGTSQKVYDFDENSITSGIMQLLHPDQKVIGLLTGHKELNPSSSEGRSISKLVEYLESDNYVVSYLDLSSKDFIPDEVAIVLILAPQMKLHDPEINMLRDFINKGGSLAVFLEPFSDHGMDGLLTELGVEDPDDQIYDTNDNWFGEKTVPVIKTFEFHPITESFGQKSSIEGGEVGKLVMTSATSLKINPTKDESLNVFNLALASENSWGETASDSEEFNSDVDIAGPVSVAVLGTKTLDGSVDGKEKSNFIIVGDADFLTDSSIMEGSNADFVLNSMNWLAGKESLIGERQDIASERRINLEGAQVHAVKAINLTIPLLIAGFGFFMWMKRRN